MSDPELPFVDELMQPVAASVDATWRALTRVMTSPPRRSTMRYAKLVGVRGAAPFEVARSEPPLRLVLVGEHRFARYSLIFTVDHLGPGLTALRAQTWAAFPGPHGRVYRAAVIGTRAHVLVLRRLLSHIARRAERSG